MVSGEIDAAVDLDGRDVVFSSGSRSFTGGEELWRMPVSASGKPAQPRFIGVQGATPSISRQGNRLFLHEKVARRKYLAARTARP